MSQQIQCDYCKKIIAQKQFPWGLTERTFQLDINTALMSSRSDFCSYECILYHLEKMLTEKEEKLEEAKE